MKIKESFSDAAGQWEKDKVGMQNIAQEDQKQKVPMGDAEAVAGDIAAVSRDQGPAQPAGGKVEEKVVA